MGPSHRYFIANAFYGDFSTLQPVDATTPPAPGFIILFGNPINSQTWTQPTGTSAQFIGIFDFTQATVLGIGGGGGGTLNISVNGVPLGSNAPVANFNNVLPAALAGFLNCNFAKDLVGDIVPQIQGNGACHN